MANKQTSEKQASALELDNFAEAVAAAGAVDDDAGIRPDPPQYITYVQPQNFTVNQDNSGSVVDANSLFNIDPATPDGTEFLASFVLSDTTTLNNWEMIGCHVTTNSMAVPVIYLDNSGAGNLSNGYTSAEEVKVTARILIKDRRVLMGAYFGGISIGSQRGAGMTANGTVGAPFFQTTLDTLPVQFHLSVLSTNLDVSNFAATHANDINITDLRVISIN